MSKKVALFYYFLLLAVTIAGLIIVMPKQLTISIGKDRVCSGTLKAICERLPLPAKKDVTLARPNLAFTVGPVSFVRDLELKQGLDIKGGTQVTLSADMKDIKSEDRERALQTAQEIISRRINLYGVSEAYVQSARTSQDYRLIAEIPGIQNSNEAVALIGSTAQLDFREYVPATKSGTVASASGMLISDFKPTGLSGKELSNATVQFDSQTAKPVIGLEFTSEGTQKFASITKRNIGKPIAIFIDGYPITSPIVNQEISDGRAQISGDFTPEQAKSLSIALNAGSLPVPIQVIGQKTVEATLGAQTVERAVRAGAIGVGIIMLFVIMLYGVRGFLAVLSLCLYGIISLALYKLVPVTLSLAGIAGFLLSMGMAVDTNILVFERLVEEERKTLVRSPKQILDQAFSRAWNSIKDANMTTLITCFVLYNPFDWAFLNRSGVVRGFALTLALGIGFNIFCGMFVTRVLMALFYSPKKK
jgi:preprotein translocase subunit SecD